MTRQKYGLSLYGSQTTYKLSLLAADSLLNTVSTSGANTNDGDGGAVSGQERADDRDVSDNAQKASELVHIRLIGLWKKKYSGRRSCRETE